MTTKQRTIYQIVDGFTEDCYEGGDTRDALYAAAERMEKAGWSYALIEKLLWDIYAAIMSDFVSHTPNYDEAHEAT